MMTNGTLYKFFMRDVALYVEQTIWLTRRFHIGTFFIYPPNMAFVIKNYK